MSSQDLEFDSYKKDYIDYCYSLKRKSKGVTKSNRLGWQSHSDLYKDEENPLIRRLFRQVVNTLRGDGARPSFYNEEFFKKNNYNIQMNALWVSINPRYATNIQHVHSPDAVAGVFYIKTSKNCGDLVFPNEADGRNPKLYDILNNELKEKWNMHPTYTYAPKEGRMILFDGALPHFVDPNLSRADRISMSFNLNFINN